MLRRKEMSLRVLQRQLLRLLRLLRLLWLVERTDMPRCRCIVTDQRCGRGCSGEERAQRGRCELSDLCCEMLRLRQRRKKSHQ